MIITLILLVAMCLWGIQTGKGRAYEGYISKGRSNAIKGQFILIVFLSHIQNYIVNAGYVYHGLGDEAFLMFFNMIGQLMVVMFLFYSGFGVMESIRIKGDTYIRTIPKHRVLNTLVNFDIAVCFFLIVDLLIGKETSLQKFILSLTTWDNLGNSNWYIFSILVCYFVTGILARVLDTTNLPGGGICCPYNCFFWIVFRERTMVV